MSCGYQNNFFFENIKKHKFNNLFKVLKYENFENLNFSCKKLLIFEINKNSEKIIGEIRLI